MRGQGETLHQLAQELETTEHKAYPTAPPELLTILLKDQFIHALDSLQLKIQDKQAQPTNLQEALARAMEFESHVESSLDGFKMTSILDSKHGRQKSHHQTNFRGSAGIVRSRDIKMKTVIS